MNAKRLNAPVYSYTEKDSEKAYNEWGSNCGPGALATMLGLTLDEVHPHIPKFDERKYTNPKMMQAALWSLGVHELESRPYNRAMAKYGLNRIQWEGPWYGKFAYRKTHWVGSMEWSGRNTFVFDINGGWMFQPKWEKEIVPILTGLYKRATGAWHITHRWELEFS
jgi:hypothetical protein